jgi:CDGSH-type Zn-finger protein
MSKERKIIILENGPYLVEGNIPLAEKINVLEGRRLHKFIDGRLLPQAETYRLCRCGHTTTPPFCDGSHVAINFDGTETASTASYRERAKALEGPNLTMLDDNRCALSKFCHRKKGTAWSLTLSSNYEDCREEAIHAASDCPTGRLVALDEAGNEIENSYEPSIDIMQEPLVGVSGGIFVKGGIPLFSESGKIYQVRNRYVLCRCGKSYNKPFCDAIHISAGYLDQKPVKEKKGLFRKKK